MLEQINSIWGGHRAGPLASLLVMLRSVYLLHQAHHWQSAGKSYYGDHLLFQRIYETVLPEMDSVAERTVGLGGAQLVYSAAQSALTTRALEAFSDVEKHAQARMPASQARVFSSLNAEMALIEAIDKVLALRNSNGVQNLLQGIADTHEGNVYLLQQRLSDAE